MKISLFWAIAFVFSTVLFNSCKSEKNQIISEQYGVGLSEGFVYAKTAQSTDDSLFIYGAEVRLPQLVADNHNVIALNLTIKNDFDAIIQQVQSDSLSDKESFIKIDYNYYIEDTIVTIVVYEQHALHLSEGTCRYEVYHYDFKNNKILTTTDVLASWGMSQVPLLNAIVEQITMPGEENEPDFDSLWFETIKWKNLNKLKIYHNEKKQLTVIYTLKENGIEGESIIE